MSVEISTEIKLSDVYPIANLRTYKLHLACRDEHGLDPLDIFVRDRAEWDGWNTWRGVRDDFNREFIFSLMDFYPQQHQWLFGGAYKIVGRRSKNKAHSYDIERVSESEPYVGRLKLVLKRPSRTKAFNLENYYSGFVVSEILPEPYSGESFSGYDKIDLSFTILEGLIQRQRLDWKTALENTKGIYLITDSLTGRRYVGAAYGTTGIWSRWQSYVKTGHGYNDELTRLITKLGLDHARHAFRFALLEYFPMKTNDNLVMQRESHWKNVLLTRRAEFGYNKN